ncbi:MAG: hypothetical protein ABSD44_03700 [Terracidiphilus sp.]
MSVWGGAEVLGDRVTILASDALKPEKIDVPRAKEQLERGHKEWNEAGDSEAAYTEALRVIGEAEAKIASAAEKHYSGGCNESTRPESSAGHESSAYPSTAK